MLLIPLGLYWKLQLVIFISHSSPVELESLLGCGSHDTPCCLPVVQPLLPITRCSAVTQQHAIWNVGCLENLSHGNLRLCRWIQTLILTQKLEINIYWAVERFCLFRFLFFLKFFSWNKFFIITINLHSEKNGIRLFYDLEISHLICSNLG